MSYPEENESLFEKSLKYHKGKFYERRWVFGISQQSDKTTLLEMIKKHVDSKCNILVSDGWELENCWHEHLVCDSQRRVCEQ